MPVNDVTAITPAVWGTMVSYPLYKSLVAMDIADTQLFDSNIRGKTFQIPRFASLSAKTYTPGADITATNQDWAFDTLTVSAYKYADFYQDDVEFLQRNVDSTPPMAADAAFQLRNKVDQHVFQKITGSTGFVNFQADAAVLQGGTAHRPVSAGSANVINLFANARKLLRQNNVEENGDWCAVINPVMAAGIDIKTTSVGFNIADATLRNGYVGDFMGFQVYISNNLPSGKCSTISPTLSVAAVSATNCRGLYFGRKGMIKLVMQKTPSLEIRPFATKLGANFVTWIVFGDLVPTNNRSRGLNVAMDITSTSGSGG